MHACCPQACLHCRAAQEAPPDREPGCACLQVPYQTCASTSQEWHLARMVISLSPPTMRSMCIHLTSPAAPLMPAEKDRRTPLHTSCLHQGQQMGSLTLSKAHTQGALQRLQRVKPSPARKASPAGLQESHCPYCLLVLQTPRLPCVQGSRPFAMVSVLPPPPQDIVLVEVRCQWWHIKHAAMLSKELPCSSLRFGALFQGSRRLQDSWQQGLLRG